MKKLRRFFSRFYMVLCFAFFYLPILVTVIFSFNSSKSLTNFTGFSMRWYSELLANGEVMSAVYVSVTVALLSTAISTVLWNNDRNRTFQIPEVYEGVPAEY